jgi:hypothetical protein
MDTIKTAKPFLWYPKRKNVMKSYNTTFSASPATQTIRDTGRGHVDRIVINHAETTAQTVSFYDRDGLLLAQYQVHPNRSPFVVDFGGRRPMWFTNGLSINTGPCVVSLVIVY